MYKTWMTISETVLSELAQCTDEGRDVRRFSDEAQLIYECFTEGQLLEDSACRLIDKMRSSPVRDDYPYNEPNSLNDIKLARPGNRDVKPLNVNWDSYYDKVYGAWLGRCAGCLLGKPIECWHRERITGLLKETGNYPVKHYISSEIDISLKDKYKVVDMSKDGLAKVCWINNVACAPVDDDTNYTALYLKILENEGCDFTSEKIAEYWLRLLPIYETCTAERVAYKNIVNLILPPMSASHYNAYRELIGAQIRADFFGYVNPGNPEKAAEYAWRDGRVSHVKNGIYGEMFMAAMIARAAVSNDINDIILAGLNEIPKKSRLSEGIEEVLKWHDQKISWEEAIEKIHATWNEKEGHQWCHVISNAVVCVVSLLWGEKDFVKTIGISVMAGFDTDCNAASVGSVIGMIVGAKALPDSWMKPLNNKLLTVVNGMEVCEISDLAKRTYNLAKKLKEFS